MAGRSPRRHARPDAAGGGGLPVAVSLPSRLSRDAGRDGRRHRAPAAPAPGGGGADHGRAARSPGSRGARATAARRPLRGPSRRPMACRPPATARRSFPRTRHTDRRMRWNDDDLRGHDQDHTRPSRGGTRPPRRVSEHRQHLRAADGAGRRAGAARRRHPDLRHLLRRPLGDAGQRAALRRVRGDPGGPHADRRAAAAGDPRRALRHRAPRRAVRGARPSLPVALRNLAGTERRRAGRRADRGGILERRPRWCRPPDSKRKSGCRSAS